MTPGNSRPAALGWKQFDFRHELSLPERQTRSAYFHSLYSPTRFPTRPVDLSTFCISLRSNVLRLPVDNRAPVTATSSLVRRVFPSAFVVDCPCFFEGLAILVRFSTLLTVPPALLRRAFVKTPFVTCTVLRKLIR